MTIVKGYPADTEWVVRKNRVANSQIIKAFNFAGEIMEAAWLLVNPDGVYQAVIGCGKGYTIQDG
jgi:hypothetical protein